MTYAPSQSPGDIALGFLRRVLPEGDYIYATSSVEPGMDKRSWRNIEHRNFETMIAENFQLSQWGFNTYFGLSTFKQGPYYVPGQDRPKFRTQENAHSQKSVWLDIDCEKEGAPYPSAFSGLQALQEFVYATQLPEPTIVLSGQGLHVFWVFTRPCPMLDWYPMAENLRALASHFGLRADLAKTVDAATGGRLPGTLNYGKDGVPRLVRLLSDSQALEVGAFSEFLQQVVNFNGVQTIKDTRTPGPTVGGPDAPMELRAQFNATGQSYRQDTLREPARIIQECRQVREAGFDEYHNWYNMMLVMKHCVCGQEVAHLISKANPVDYFPHVVDEKWGQAIAGGAGPAKCSTFASNNGHLCNGCPYQGKITSPVELGEPHRPLQDFTAPATAIQGGSTVNPVIATAPIINLQPFYDKESGFEVSPGNGIVWHKKVMVDGDNMDTGPDDVSHYVTKDIPLLDTEIYIHGICGDDSSGDMKRSYVIRKIAPSGYQEDILFDVDTAAGTHQYGKWLMNHGMAPLRKNDKAMDDFMRTYIHKVQTSLPVIKLNKRFGWVDGNQFIVGDTIYTPKGPVPANLDGRCAKMARNEFTHAGDITEWVKIPEMYNYLDQKVAQLFICAGFAAPLMKFSVGTASNAMLSIWDAAGGHGKTNLLRAVNSIWGHPDDMLLSKEDTMVAKYQTLACRHNLPACFDELTTIDDKAMAAMLYNIASGKEKRKSESGGMTLADTGSWSTTTMFTSNRSLYELMERFSQQTTATSMRVMEFRCDFPDYSMNKPIHQYIEQILYAMQFHYGLAGRVFIDQIVRNPHLLDNMTARVMEWEAQVRTRSDERFWTYNMGLFLEAGRMAKAFGLINYDMDALEVWVKEQLRNLSDRIHSRKASSKTLLAEFLQSHLNETLQVTAAARTPEQNDPGNDSGFDSYVLQLPRASTLSIRVERDTNRIYVSARKLREWHYNNMLALDVTLEDLKKDGIWVPRSEQPGRPDHKRWKFQANLGKGVSYVGRGGTECYMFDGNKLSLPDDYQIQGEEKT